MKEVEKKNNNNNNNNNNNSKPRGDAEEKNHLAALCSLVMQNPEKNLKLTKQILEKTTEEHSLLLRKLAIISAGAVFKDILPSYPIRELTVVENETVVTKEVKQLRDYEQLLLKYYKKYLVIIEKGLKDASLAFNCAKVFCDLLISAKNFNFHPNVVAVVTPLLDSSSDQISSLVHSSILEAIREDFSAESSLLIVRSITDLVKRRGYRTRENVLDIFLELNLNEVLNASESLDKPIKKSSEKKVTKNSEEKNIEKQLQEAETVMNKREMRKRQNEILKYVFVTYFRIIKKAQGSVLLPSVLQGFSKFAHLINIEVVHDLLQVLKSFISAESTKSAEHKLEAIVTAFEVAKHQETLNVDLKEFYNHFYSLLNDLYLSPSDSKSHRREILTLNALSKLFLEPKKLPIERVAGFIKRLAILSLGSNSEVTIGILLFLHRMFKKYPKTTQLIDGENAGSGVFIYDSEDPEHSNSFSATLAELIPLTKSFHPIISSLTKQLIQIHTSDESSSKIQNKIDQKARELLNSQITLEEVFHIHDFMSSGEVKPFPKRIQQHPLEVKMKNDRKRQFFVQLKYNPNDTEFGRKLESKRMKQK